MGETTSPPENLKTMHATALAAFTEFIGQGITNPDVLDLSNPRVINANELLDAWSNHAEAQATSLEAKFVFTLARSTFYIDAGFSDPDYIDEVANDWLAQDLQNAVDSGLDNAASKIQTKIEELNARLA